MDVHTHHPQKQIVYPPTFLLYMDVLGFSDYCLHDMKRAKQVVDTVNFVVSEERDAINILAVSDSMFVSLPDDRPASESDSVRRLIEFAFKLQVNLAMVQSFMRAIVEYGHYTWFVRGGMESIYGECVVRAVAAEKQANLAGVVIASRLAQFVDGPAIPLASGHVFLPMPAEKFLGNGGEIFYRTLWGYAKHHPAASVRDKLANTIECYRACRVGKFDHFTDSDWDAHVGMFGEIEP